MQFQGGLLYCPASDSLPLAEPSVRSLVGLAEGADNDQREGRGLGGGQAGQQGGHLAGVGGTEQSCLF